MTTWTPLEDEIVPSSQSIQELALDYAEAKADQAALEVTRQYLLKAISCLPGRTLKVSLTEQADMAAQPFKMEAKRDDSGNVFLRAVKTFS